MARRSAGKSVPLFTLGALVGVVLGAAPASADDGPPVVCPHNAVAIVTKCDTSLYRFDEGGGIDQPSGVAVTPDDRTIVTGGLSDAGGTRMTLAASDAATGAERWRYHWAKGAGYGASGFDTALSPDGKTAVVTGEAKYRRADGYTGTESATVAVDVATGRELWVNEDPLSGHGYRLAFAPDGRTLYVGGQQYTYANDAGPQTETGNDWVVSALDAVTGQQRWRVVLASPYVVGNTSDFLDAMSVSPDGTAVAVAGRWAVADVLDPNHGTHRGVSWSTQVLTAATGAVRWNATTKGGLGNDYPHAVAWSPDGSTVVTGGELQLSVTGSVDQGAVAAFAAGTGAQRWLVTLPAGSSGSTVSDLQVSPDGRAVLVTGEVTSDATGADYLTRSLALADGAERWRATFMQTGGDVPQALAVSPDGGTVYVTGSTQQPANGWDGSTVAYRVADGGERWVANYSGPNTRDPEGEILQSIGVSGDGRVLAVAMRSPGTITSTDMAVLGYDTSSDRTPPPPVPGLP